MALCLINGRCQPAEQRMVGGPRAAIFVYALWGLDIMAFLANAGSLITYFTGFINFGLAKSATTQTNYMGTAFLLALVGGYLSDTYISRFAMCVIGGSIQVLGYVVLTIQARYDSLRPTPCEGLAAFNSEQCEHASSGQLAILYTGLYLVALGVSGIRAGLPPLGADQFDETDQKGISSFFNWFLFSLTTGAIVGLTLVVWISANQGWAWGFGVCAIALFIGTVVIFSGKPFFRINKPDGNGPIVRILQVCTAAARNWRLPVPEESSMLHESEDKEVGNGVEVLTRTDQFRFLDKAAIIKSAHSSPSSHVSGPWHICTVTQIEETKIILRMIPIILSTIFMNTCLAQLQTFSVQQGVTMDPDLFGLKVPAATLPVVPFLFMIFLVPIYDKIFVPVTRRFTGIPTGITQLQRIGIGLVLSVISMAIAAVIEIRRKHVAIEHNMVDSFSPLPMSAFWLAPQYAVFGAADLFTLAGLLEFFYAESSLGMKSLGTSISWCSLALGYFLSSVVVEVVNKASGGWLASNNLNRGKLNNFYWLLAGLSVVNFGFYLLCSTWYTYKKVEVKQLDTSNVTPLDISDGEELQPIGKR